MNLRTFFVAILWGVAAAAAVLAVLTSTARADTIRLRNGAVYQGRIVSDRSDRVILAVKGVEVRLPRMDIDEIVHEGPPFDHATESGADEAANRYLEKIARDPAAKAEWRLSAVRALGANGGTSALKVLADLLGADLPAIRDAACVAFIGAAEAPLDPAVRRAVEFHAEASETALRRAAMRCLGTGDPSADYVLAAHAAVDPEESVRTAAVESLGRSRTAFARGALERARNDPASEVRVLATRALEIARHDDAAAKAKPAAVKPAAAAAKAATSAPKPHDPAPSIVAR